MLWPIRVCLWLIAKCLLALRYRIRVHGLEQLRSVPRHKLLVLPNHPALIDPPIILTLLWPLLHPRPMVYGGNFRGAFYIVAKLLDVLEIPDLDRASTGARAQAEQAIAGVITGLNRGENHLLWPAGRIEQNGTENLGSTRALADILQAVPDAQVVLVRTRGLYGSSFSFARTGKSPTVMPMYLRGAWLLLANLVFFAPRRRVDITVELADRRQMPEPRREVLNPWLESWYNQGGPERPTYVPYHLLFGPRTYEFPRLASSAEVDLARVKPETKEAIAQLLADKLGRPLTDAENQPATTLDQLGLDSLDRMELALHVEQRFGFTGEQAPSNLGQLWVLAQGLVDRAPSQPPPPRWFQPVADEPAAIVGSTLLEAFVSRALRNRRDTIVADDMAGVLAYERLLVGSLILSRRFAKVAAPNVGLLLPASVASDVSFFGLHLAGKLPVLLNWTTGPANLAHAARVMKLTHVVTSKRFLDRANIQIDGVEFLFLEDVRGRTGKVELLRTLALVRWFPGRIRSSIPPADPNAAAVVLFTSGSEKAPKAVPLTHSNLLNNQRSACAVLGITRQDSVLGFLPAFHSFGMSVTSLLPLLCGVKVVHHPDPTDAGGLVRKVAAYRPTILCGTPTFMSYILDRAQPGQLDALRIIVVGAEKCPQSVFDRCARIAPRAQVLEGYGITECSPVVSVNPPAANRPGTLGLPLPGVEVRVVDADSGAPLAHGRLGMLLVSGPSVFPGYLAHDGPSPFCERDGKRWYITGDLAKVDEQGYIHFGGRLKRFLKAGGEMISLPALEEPFAQMFPPTDEGPRVAVEGVEVPSGRRIVLFCTEDLNLRDANARLLAEGHRGVMRLDEVRKIDKIPVLGTGKTDYKQLRAQV